MQSAVILGSARVQVYQKKMLTFRNIHRLLNFFVPACSNQIAVVTWGVILGGFAASARTLTPQDELAAARKKSAATEALNMEVASKMKSMDFKALNKMARKRASAKP